MADGTPVAGADLLFVPADESSAAMTATARTNDEGAYAAKTHAVGQEVDGVVPGQYVVVVRKFEGGGSSEELQEKSEEELDQLREEAMSDMGDSGSTSDNVLPEQYASQSTTPLTAEVVADQENEVTLELEP